MKLFQKKLGSLITIMLLITVGSQYSYGIENDGSRYASESKLNKAGKWVKLKVENNAIYKLTYEDIQKMGVNPSKAKIFGYGGWILDEDFTTPYVDDLPEVVCWKSGSGDELKAGEYLLFYGRGTVKWSYSTSNKEYVHENNPYSTYGVYFLTDAVDGNLKKMEALNSPVSVSTTLSAFEDYALYEKEEYSIAKSGRELYGDSFSGKNTQIFSVKIPGILKGDENGNSSFKGSSVTLSFASDPGASTKLTLSVNNSSDQYIDLITTTTNSSSDTYTKGISTKETVVWKSDKNENTKIQIAHPCGVKMAYLNYIRLNMMRKLQYYNTAYTFFRSSENLTKNIQYDIQNANQNLLVFDVTDNYNIKKVQTTFSNNILSFKIVGGEIKEFVLVDPNLSFSIPQVLGEVATQNLHGLGQIDMAIISPKAFVSEAERLAEKHRESSRQLKVVVVTPDQIYNEFSSGVPDATAYRRFMKMFFDRGTSGNDRPKYLLLFADGIYDNRFIDPSCKSLNKDNFLLTYQTKESSLTTDESCPADDYFGFLDEKEEKTSDGSLRSNGVKKLMLGIGRFPIQSLAAAKSSVDKQIAYMDNKNLGIWKNSVVLLADDSDTDSPGSSFTLHMKQADSIANSVMQKKYPEYMVTKVYMDAFSPENSGGKKTFDNTAKKKLMKSLSDGCFVLNYTGHGGTIGLADNIVALSDIPKMTFKNLPLWITATCEYAWFDATSSSIGEEVFLSEKSAGIALFSTSRVVYSPENLQMNLALMQSLFAKENGLRPALGDVMRKGKNMLPSSNNYKNNKLKYVLLGDPALVLNYPEYEIEITQINDKWVDNNPFTFQALETVKISGFVKYNGSKDNSFNGMLNANIFDGMQTVETVTTNTSDSSNPKDKHSYFTDYPIRISSTYGKVENGDFEFTFSVMRDITDSQNFGKINLYAYSYNVNGREANGSFLDYYIQGTDDDADISDETGPVVKNIYLNDSTFKSGDVVNEKPYFVAKVRDEKYGINISGAAAGHDIQIVIDNSPSATYSLNDYYKASENEKNTGTIAYSVPELTEGEHTLRFQVWNNMNNVTIETFNFSVRKGLQPKMSDLIASVNPARIGTGTKFAFTHDRPETLIEVNMSVYDLSGKKVWSHKETGSSESSYEVPWDLIGSNGGYVQPGVYIYSAAVKTEGGTETTQSKKLIVLGQ